MIASVYTRDKTYYPQNFVEGFECIVKGKKMPNFITDDINIFSNDSDRGDSDYSDKKNSNE